MDGTLRVASQSDAAAIEDIYAPVVEQSHVSFETTPPDVAAVKERIRTTVDRFPWLVCEYDGQVVGYTYAGEHNDRPAYQWGVNVSVYVAEDYRRNGVARGLYQSLFAMLEAQGFFTVYAIITLPNPPSVALHEELGFERVGLYEKAGYKLGDWRDVGHWEHVLRPHETPPSSPTPFDAFRTTEECNDALRVGEPSIRL